MRTAGSVGDAPAAAAPAFARPERTIHAATFYAIAIFAVVLDQAVKAWIRAAQPVGGSMPLWPGVFHLTHTQNRGMAFSLLEGQVPLLAAAALIVVGGIVWAQTRHGSRLPAVLGWALSLALGGAVGNLIDRVRLGYVTDLFDARIINFPVFNVADTAITFGIGLLAWRVLTTAGTPEGEEGPHPPPPSPADGRGGEEPPVAFSLPSPTSGRGVGGEG